MEQKKYRAGVIGLGWMGLLYDLGKRDYERIGGSYQTPIYDVESADRPLPDGLNVKRAFHLYDHPGQEGLATSYAAALFDRPEVELVAGADRDPRRRAMYGERYGIEALYADAQEMLDEERLDIVAIATNTEGRSALTVAAVAAGVRGVLVDKPMVFSLAEADAMVGACAEAGVPLVGGATSVSHPSFCAGQVAGRGGGDWPGAVTRSAGSGFRSASGLELLFDRRSDLGVRHGRSAAAGARQH